ncbi:unnamed protein product [Phytomonas sp. Hart1]|nr:unnamed protein product [Phytomonas sp. Hart1]|eukprot:CCW69975.1 unnamed protein product [Phytomonas sp. isolate Hart1]
MFRRSCRLVWTPNYFRYGRRTDRLATKMTSKKRQVLATAGAPKRGMTKRPHKEEENSTWVSSLHYVNMQLTRLNISEKEDSWRRSAREKLIRTSQKLHSEWKRLPALLPKKAQDDQQACLCFQTRQDVLGPLSSFLRVPRQPHTSSFRGDHLKLYRVVEDAEIVDDKAPPLAHRTSAGSISSDTSRDWGITRFSLEDLIGFLELYHYVESEDGPLLGLLLHEVNQFLFGNVMPLLETSGAESVRVRLPLPQLLFILSELGITEERMLQAIVCRSHEKLPPSHPGDPTTRGLLYANLPLYTTRDLVVLMVALHRFGLQQDYAFERTIKALKVRLWRSDSPEAHLRLTIKKMELNADSPLGRESRDGVANELGNSDNEPADRWLRHLPRLEKDLQCPLEVLVEAITALSVSVFRPRDVLALVANLLLVSAHAELKAVLGSALISPSEKKSTMLAISHQLHQAVHLYEEMNELQPLLAELLTWSCTVSEVGVLIDGEESAEIPSERRACYDHVTADLVKVNSV